jgi:hypothetical protein
MPKRFILCLSCVALLSSPSATTTAAAQKKGENHRYHWQFTARHSKTKKAVEFQYRIVDGTITDIQTNAVIGKSQPLANQLARVTLNKNSPFPGEFDIKFTGKATWTGTMNDPDGVWHIRLHTDEKLH